MIFFGRASGYILGTLSTPFAEKVDHLFILGVTVFICGISATFIPYCKTLWQISCLVAFDGAAMGVLDTVGNIAVLRLWNGKADEGSQSTVLHMFHACFGTGGLIQGLLTYAF